MTIVNFTPWAGLIAPPRRQLRTQRYGQPAPALGRGEEMGRFKLGSTAIVLFGPGRTVWDESLRAGDAVRMGQGMGHMVATQA